eukprot:TRINITY_DN4238_c0_g1_i2.p1 TRINITY_DN4238_c0_g1~~TRINITY_DN4238_c0_g1_i2.p1  ORF type:complete len:726 (+),score=117.23 TRINITY_DN4238_c0_g1_i2:83-2260(+)
MQTIRPSALDASGQNARTELQKGSAPGEQADELGLDRGYTNQRFIGRGSFGAALLVRDSQGQERVIKAIDLSSLNSKQREAAPREPEIMQRMRHPYIVRFRESFLEKGMLAIVMDYAGAGDLLQQVDAARRQQTPLPEEQVTLWFTQATLGVKYMHNLNIIHRDLKSENLFLEKRDHIRIGDFGLSKVLCRPSSVCIEQQIVGTPYYLSPEICSEGVYSTASDMWALGCVLFELLSLSVPFEATNLPTLMVRITSDAPAPRITASCSEGFADLCASLMLKCRTDRPCASEVLQHSILCKTTASLLAEVSRLKQLEIKEVPSEIQVTQEKQLSSPSAPGVLTAESPEPVAVQEPQTTRERCQQVCHGAPEARPRSLSPDVAYRHQLLLSKSGAGTAVGTPQQWLRGQRNERSSSNLRMTGTKCRAAEAGTELEHPEIGRPTPPRQVPRLQLDVCKAESLTALDILSAEALPPSAWTSTRQQEAPLPLQKPLSNREAAPGILRSKSSSALSSARVNSGRGRQQHGLDSYRRPPVGLRPVPPLLKLGRLQEQQSSGKGQRPAAPRGCQLRGLESARAKSAMALPSARRLENARAPASVRSHPSARRTESSDKKEISKERRCSKERKEQHGQLRTALRPGRQLLQNAGVAIGEAPPVREQPRQQYTRGQEPVRPLMMQRPVAQKTVSKVHPALLMRSPSAPAGLHSARGQSKPRIHPLQRHGVGMPKHL